MNWQQFWQQKKIGNMALLPISAVFYMTTAIRRWCYGIGVLTAEKVALPVVVVGNITSGGAGKTPLVIALGKLLAEQGIKYAVISKGYGGSYGIAKVVEKGDLASIVGDEPLLIKLKCNCPVVVAKSRVKAAKIVSEQFSKTQIILTDDGLQHYQLAREIEICVINQQMGLGNGWLLPAGGLRESVSRLKTIDFVVSNGGKDSGYYYILADRGWYHINRDEHRYHDDFSNDIDSENSQNRAISGIAYPDLFFQQLAKLGIDCETIAFPDHHVFSKNDLPDNKTLLMTEKDWVKAKQYQHDDAWYLAVEAILSGALKKDFLVKIKPLINH
ncbi:MAG: tetraacyldisaccharide 4'-kinase [Ostreibacterium sp.]